MKAWLAWSLLGQVTSFTANQLTLIIIGRPWLRWHAQGFRVKRVSRGGTRGWPHADLLVALFVSFLFWNSGQERR